MSEQNGDSPPSFDDPFEGEDGEQRVYGTLLQTREPTGVSHIAEQAGSDPKPARKYLEWFTDLGVATRHEGHPVTYERNDAYFEWRQVNRIRDQYSEEEIVALLSDVLERIEEYQEQFGTDDPDTVSLVDSSRAMDTEEAWEALSEWKTLERRAERLDMARRGDDSSAPSECIDI